MGRLKIWQLQGQLGIHRGNVFEHWSANYYIREIPSFIFQKKKQQKKKSQLKFTIDCTHPVEDGILKANDLVGYQRR
jgi:outer membrane phospholipase A